MKLRIISALLLTATAWHLHEARAQSRRVSLQTTEQSLLQMPAMPEVVEVFDCDMVDVEPSFPGGSHAMVQYINTTRHYPAEAYSRGVEGRVLCAFVVQPDGRVTHVNVLRGVEPSLDREAVRILASMPHWEAGRIGATMVPVYCILPVNFRR